MLNMSFLAMLIESIQRLLHIIAAHHRAIKNTACCLSASSGSNMCSPLLIHYCYYNEQFFQTSRSTVHS